jgi:predicted aldo/keto reductase-like oxidoreductase
VREIWGEAKTPRRPAEWALRWVWNHPEVTVVLSGMSAMEQVKQNVSLAGTGHAGSLTKAELSLYGKVRKELETRVMIPCTNCGYCMPCQNGVNIPICFEEFNKGNMYEAKEQATQHYMMLCGGFFDNQPHFASVCEECGECEEKCPQSLPIREHLKKVAEYFGK